MIRSFRNRGTEDVFNGRNSRDAGRVCPPQLHSVARRKLERLDDAVRLADLAVPPQNRLEALVGDGAGQHSIRVNERYRVCFCWTADGPEAVELVDYHD